MRTDTVCAIIRFDRHLTADYDEIWTETYVKEDDGYIVFYGNGAAKDCHLAEEDAQRLNKSYGNVDKEYKPVRLDIEDAIKEGLIYV